MTNRYLSAKEVAKLLGIAESTAYAVIREWNKELKKEGFFTKVLFGKLNKPTFFKLNALVFETIYTDIRNPCTQFCILF